ncbi:MAG TPA: MBL fold metallo-hydrolase [bacterium]|nr:MBL fold metallo-hydrolase [bacterium]
MKKLLRARIAPLVLTASFAFMPLSLVSDALSPLASDNFAGKRWKAEYRTPLSDGEISFQWLGTAGFRVQKGDTVILIDPYLTRVPLHELFIAPLRPNERLIREKIPRADFIFVTDSHFDHFMDVPAIALRTGAKVVGSTTTAKLLRIHGVSERQIVEARGGETLRAGPFTVRVARARHGTILVVKPFLYDVDARSRPPLYVWEYGNLQNLCFHFESGGYRFFATSGVEIDERDAKGFESDLAMVNVTVFEPGSAGRMAALTKPKVIMPTHYDNYFNPLENGVVPFPFATIGVIGELERSAPGAQVVTLDFFQEYRATCEQR